MEKDLEYFRTGPGGRPRLAPGEVTEGKKELAALREKMGDRWARPEILGEDREIIAINRRPSFGADSPGGRSSGGTADSEDL